MTPLPGLFVTGTDTGVGKTTVSAAIARGLTQRGVRAGALKPVATGGVRTLSGGWTCEDGRILCEAIGLPSADEERVAPLVFEAPLAPPASARQAGTILEFTRVRTATEAAIQWWSDSAQARILIVEGVGGWLCPIAEGATVADLAIAIDYPLLIVARLGLGTLNHTLLTVEAAQRRGLRIAGIVLNASDPDPSDSLAEATNPIELARLLDGIPILAVSDREASRGGPAVWAPALDRIDWEARAAVPRTKSNPTTRMPMGLGAIPSDSFP